jgi:phosphotriesterase-related protein
MNRRDFLQISAAAGIDLLTTGIGIAGASSAAGTVMTVLGPVTPARLGSTLCHEHVLVDFIGADRISPGRYDTDEAFAVALPHLQRARALGCRAFVECTPAYLGRDPRLLARLAVAARLHVLTNTGYYGAAKDQYVPKHAFDDSADRIADRWVKEWRDGIDGTGIRPGFIKTGVDAGPLSAIDRTLVQAAALTHARTGLVIASHTGDTRAALEQFEVLASASVPPDAFIWVHAQNDWQIETRVEAARRGAWIEIDNVADETVPACVERATVMKDRGLLRRVLVSHDAGWYRPGEPKGGRFRSFEKVYTTLVPALRRADWTADEVRQLLEHNPAEAFTIRTGTAA